MAYKKIGINLPKNNIKQYRQQPIKSRNRGDSPITKKIERELTSFWHTYLLLAYGKKAKNQTAFRL